MEESILKSIKKLLGIAEDEHSFDVDIKIHINSAIQILKQIGVQSTFEDFILESEETTWDDYLIDIEDLEDVKTYIYLKVKIIFDPPTNSAVLQNYKELIKEYEWRLNSKKDYE